VKIRRRTSKMTDLVTLFQMLWFPAGLLLLIVLAAIRLVAALRPGYLPVSNPTVDSMMLGILLGLSAKVLVRVLSAYGENGDGCSRAPDRDAVLSTYFTAAGLLFLIVLAAIRLVTALRPASRIVDAVIFVIVIGVWVTAVVTHYCRRKDISLYDLQCAAYDFVSCFVPEDPCSRRGCRFAATLYLMGIALVGGVRYQTSHREIPDVYQFTVYIGQSTIQVPWSVSLVSNTPEPPEDVTAALLKERTYNIPGGDLRRVLHQTLHPIGVPLFTNDQFEAFGGKDEPKLAAALKADMSGFKAPSIVGRFTAIRAMERALSGTDCRQEMFQNAAVYVFCRLHIQFHVTLEGGGPAKPASGG